MSCWWNCKHSTFNLDLNLTNPSNAFILTIGWFLNLCKSVDLTYMYRNLCLLHKTNLFASTCKRSASEQIARHVLLCLSRIQCYILKYIDETCVWTPNNVLLAKIAMEISVVQIQVETERGVYSSSIVICLSARTCLFLLLCLLAGLWTAPHQDRQ